jgi:hypothetical protein
MTFTPLIDYAGYEHVLNAMPCFVHPGNGNLYGIAIEKRGGTRQNLSVYRVRPGNPAREHVYTYRGGGIDAQTQIAAGGCVILQDGSLQVWASADPVGGSPITQTGFVGGFWEPIPGVDDPWTAGGTGEPGPPGPAGAGGITLLPSVATNTTWEGRTLTAGVMVDIPATFGVPSSVAYLVRVTMNAPVANVRARFGTQACPFFYTVNSRRDGDDEMDQGWVPGPVCYVSPAQGTPRVWLQIVGYSA